MLSRSKGVTWLHIGQKVPLNPFFGSPLDKASSSSFHFSIPPSFVRDYSKVSKKFPTKEWAREWERERPRDHLFKRAIQCSSSILRNSAKDPNLLNPFAQLPLFQAGELTGESSFFALNKTSCLCPVIVASEKYFYWYDGFDFVGEP